MLINLVPRVPSFYKQTRFRLKNSVTTVDLAHFFIYVFEGEIYGKLRNIHLGNPPLILKRNFFYLFTFVYTRLHSSTFVYIRLVTRLHTSTFFYTCLHSSSDSSVFLEQIFFFCATSITNVYVIKPYAYLDFDFMQLNCF